MQNVTNRKPFCKNVYAQKTNKDVFEMVRTHKNAIGIIGVSWLSRDLNNIAIVANYSKSELNEMETAAEVNHDMYSEQTEADYSQAIKVVPIRKTTRPTPTSRINTTSTPATILCSAPSMPCAPARRAASNTHSAVS